jgi:molybdopterin-guanine dinucleotide biosynthesis protein A
MMEARSTLQGYVLAGGKSRRMGEDKALLPFGGCPLGAWVAERVRQVCGEVAVVGDPAKYAAWGFPVARDIFADCGPLGGIHAALSHSEADLNLVVGCDMPYVTPEFMERLLRIAGEAQADAVVPVSAEYGYEPLCAVYKPSCLARMERALQAGRRRISEVFSELELRTVPPAEWQPYDPQRRLFQNLNTREDYEQALRELLRVGDCQRSA